MFLKIWQNSYENTCAGVSLSRSLLSLSRSPRSHATLLKKTPAQVFSCEFCEIFKNTFFKNTELLRMPASNSTQVLQTSLFQITLYYI